MLSGGAAWTLASAPLAASYRHAAWGVMEAGAVGFALAAVEELLFRGWLRQEVVSE